MQHRAGIISFAVFGIFVWASESEECATHFYHDFSSLHYLFDICVVLLGAFGLYLALEIGAMAVVAVLQVDL